MPEGDALLVVAVVVTLTGPPLPVEVQMVKVEAKLRHEGSVSIQGSWEQEHSPVTVGGLRNDSLSIDIEHVAGSYSGDAIDEDRGRGGVDLDDGVLASVAGQAVLAVVLQ